MRDTYVVQAGAAPDTIRVLLADERPLFANAAFERLTGYGLVDLRKRGPTGHVHPGNLAPLQEILDGVSRGQQFSDIEFRILTKDGRVRSCSSSYRTNRSARCSQASTIGR